MNSHAVFQNKEIVVSCNEAQTHPSHVYRFLTSIHTILLQFLRMHFLHYKWSKLTKVSVIFSKISYHTEFPSKEKNPAFRDENLDRPLSRHFLDQ
jgi:hypothetical protein